MCSRGVFPAGTVEPSDGCVHVLPAGIVNVLVLVTVNVNGNLRPAGRGPCVLKIIHAIAHRGGIAVDMGFA
ncbi:hypothetical protein JCM14469_15180 [Desulfatiferula olefinivorans]